MQRCNTLGLTPEAIENNPVMFDAMTEMTWRMEEVRDVAAWVRRHVMEMAPWWPLL
jgi:hypothetical protein